MYSYPRQTDHQLSFEADLFDMSKNSVEAPPLENVSFPVFRVQLVREEKRARQERPIIHAPQDAARICFDHLRDADREHFAVLMLDTKNRVIGIHTASIGILDSALVHPREVFKAAVLANAATILLSHNHPSGDPTPSAEDRRITQRLVEAGQILGIEVLDHVIVGEQGSFVSLKEKGLL